MTQRSSPSSRLVRALPRLIVAGLGAIAVQSACTHDWDAYDPSLSGTTGSTTGAGACVPGQAVPCYSGPQETEGVGICVAGVTTCKDDGSGFGVCEGEVTPSTETCELQDEDCDGVVNEPDSGCNCEPGATAACYDGPAGTEGAGPCQGGVQVCDPGGAGYGVCLGQVIPSVEDCATAVDDDCDGVANAGCALWSRRYGGLLDQYPWGLAVDPAGAVVIAGELHASTNFGGGTLSSAGSADVFVAKIDANGNHQWSRSWGATGTQQGLAVAIDPAGAIYVTGEFTGTLDFGVAPVLVSAGGDDVFVVKLDPAGTPLWCVSFGGALDEQGLAIAADASGVVVGGDFFGTIDFGAGAHTSADVEEDAFLVKLDAAGGTVWSRAFGNTGSDRVYGVALDGAGDVLLAGTFDETITLGGPMIGDVSGSDALVAKLAGASGAHVWSRGLGGLGDEEAIAVAVDPGGNVLVAGWFDSDIDLGAGAQGGSGGDDGFVVKLGPSGAYTWGKTFGDADDQVVSAVAADGAGNVLFALSMRGTVDFGGGALLGAGSDDMVVVKLDPGGTHLLSRRFGDASDQDPRGIRADAQGNILFVGDCQGTVNFGNGPLPANGDEDVCLVKLPP